VSRFLDECLKAAERAKTHRAPRGMIVSEGNWQGILANAKLVKPHHDGLMEFCGFKVQVSKHARDDQIVWTDGLGEVLSVQHLRQPDEA
jgi:hypothetical protein